MGAAAQQRTALGLRSGPVPCQHALHVPMPPAACVPPSPSGVAAIYLGNNPGAAPRDVSAAIVGGSTPDKIQTAKFKAGTPNRLLYSGVAQQPEVEAAGGPPAGPPASG